MAIGPSQPAVYLDIPVFNSLFPKEGGKVIPVTLNFALQQSFALDFTLLQQSGYISLFQSVFIDNSQNTQPVTIVVNGSNQNLICPGSSQGTFILLCPNPPKMTVNCAGGNFVNLFLCNLPLPEAVWSATSNFTFTALGYLETSDVALDATISGGAVNIILNATENNDVVKPFFGADEIYTGHTTTTTPQTIVTGAPSYFITSLFVGLSNDAALAAPGELSVAIKDGSTTIAQAYANLTGTPSNGTSTLLELADLQYNSKGSTQSLTLTLSAVLSAGICYWNVAGGLTSRIGP